MPSGSKVSRGGQRAFNRDEQFQRRPQLIPGESLKLGRPFPAILNGGERARLCSSLRRVTGWVRHLFSAKDNPCKGTKAMMLGSQCLAAGGRAPGIGRWTRAVHAVSTDAHLPDRLYKPQEHRDQVESGACAPQSRCLST